MNGDRLFTRLLRIRVEIEFFQELVNLGILDSTNSYIQSLMTCSNKIIVQLYKNNICIDDVYQIFDLYDNFNVILFNLFQHFRKE